MDLGAPPFNLRIRLRRSYDMRDAQVFGLALVSVLNNVSTNSNINNMYTNNNINDINNDNNVNNMFISPSDLVEVVVAAPAGARHAALGLEALQALSGPRQQCVYKRHGFICCRGIFPLNARKYGKSV